MRFVALTPLFLFLVLGVYFAAGLWRDPARIPSALIDRPVPDFELPPLETRELGLSDEDVAGEPALINVFGSYCAPCLDEHPLFMAIAQNGETPIYGIDWKDKPGAGDAWLERHGDPYTRVGDDRDGRVAIEFGVTGAPETFVVDGQGRIRRKVVGAITPEMWTEELRPLLDELKREASPTGENGS